MLSETVESILNRTEENRSKNNAPEDWMHAQQSGHRIGFVESKFDAGLTEDNIHKLSGQTQDLTIDKLSLKEIYLTQARHLKTRQPSTRWCDMQELKFIWHQFRSDTRQHRCFVDLGEHDIVIRIRGRWSWDSTYGVSKLSAIDHASTRWIHGASFNVFRFGCTPDDIPPMTAVGCFLFALYPDQTTDRRGLFLFNSIEYLQSQWSL